MSECERYIVFYCIERTVLFVFDGCFFLPSTRVLPARGDFMSRFTIGK